VTLAVPYDIPVLIDAAYSAPFSSLDYTNNLPAPILDANVIYCMSLSKAGLPRERIGIAIADEQVIQVLEGFQANVCIHSGWYGQAI
jgi:valine--pyruvate aminotransferase